MLKWEVEYDDNDKVMLVAPSRWHDDGSFFYHRLVEIDTPHEHGFHPFRIVSDPELLPSEKRNLFWSSLTQAMEFCEEFERS